MNGVLSPMPPGILSDPRQAALLQTGLGLLQASGPSRMPVGLGQAIGQAGTQGINAFHQLQQAQIAEEMRKRQMAMQEQQLKLQLDKANQPPPPMVAAPGSWVIDPKTGQPVSQVPFKPEPQKPPQAPMTRTVPMGDENVMQEFRDGQWVEIGRGARFAKSVEGVTKPPAPPKAPKDYEWTDETYTQVRPVKGGPKDTSTKDAARAQGAIKKADIVIQKVDEAMNLVSPMTTGLLGDIRGTMLGRVTGSGAFDLRKTIDTIKANLGFAELQAMREASPTGGALGQVAIQELDMLQSTIASLDAGQDDEILARNLQQVRKHYENWKNAVMQAQQQGGATEAPAAVPAAAPASPARRKYNPKTGKFE